MALIENKKARFNYEIGETYEAGIKLFGYEVKSLRKGLGSLDGAYAVVRGGETFLIGAEIPPFQAKNAPANYDPRRNRKLLLTKKEIRALSQEENKKGLTIVPISVYNKGRKIKVTLGIGKGKKKFDKRQSIKKREADREIRRTLKNK
ncbi:MAG: SsrA-binding protein [Candidatus Zambryskibacteria bacterium RIFCSPHIGHO2_12_FULL_43_12b]|uniref:SsrA-binding protein n=1 Tax=Candidatus Zambryskibacteria bacterium RIFCSPLOWO2_01_FULL_43_17 TaxID=1802760 RepID=A0A1G2U443_9BACT|nr:MAG: SsrA-binding protein [Candidatus Zambryskibacteria bacterium RIFCSPHIGHO2_12_FULL_43_12b]OHB04277.1 MAG: SsrA-binding protein [Candidatus Zambryskibacteria bacterium RIFCSPLOWO2_01_FULL_43_17]